MNFKKALLPPLVATEFMTRLPVHALITRLVDTPEEAYAPDVLTRTLKYYPLIGLLMGFILLVITQLFLYIAPTHPLYIAAIIVLCWVWLSGGLHLDGVADMTDAWIGGMGSEQKTLDIMKDPLCGTFAVIAIVLVILLKLVFVYELLSVHPLLLLFVPMFARTGVVALLVFTPYVRKQGLATSLAEDAMRPVNIASFVLFALLGLVFLWFYTGFKITLLVFLAYIAFYVYYRLSIMKRLNGITGDIAGAFIEYSEVMMLFSILTMLFLF